MKECVNCKEPIANTQYDCDVCGWEQGFEGGGSESLKVKDLKLGDEVTIAGIPMFYSYMSGKHPAFIHDVNGVTVTYVNKKYTKETLLSQIK